MGFPHKLINGEVMSKKTGNEKVISITVSKDQKEPDLKNTASRSANVD